MISQNQETFVQMLNQPASGEGAQAQGVAGGGGGGAGGPGLLRQDPASAQEGGYIQVTPAEKDAIERVSLYTYVLINIHLIMYI